MVEKIVAVLDTETTNSLDDPLCYDMGWIILDTESGEIVVRRSYAVKDIFLDKELMASAFYADKVPQYWQEIWSGQRKLADFITIKFQFAQDCADYNVKQVYAHNARFDNRSSNLTQRWLTKSKYRYFFPYGIEICDTLKMSRKVLKDNASYGEFCYKNDYITNRGQRKYTAEILYRFISGLSDFEEQHKGLDDVLIEKEILLYCLKCNPDIDGRLWE